jgi:ribonuclease P/MRP protein subunit POP8
MAKVELGLTACDEMDVDVSENRSFQVQIPTSKTKISRGHEITCKTIKNPPFSYACLELISSSVSPALDPNNNPEPTRTTIAVLDPVTIRTYITSALTQFLGLSGSAISIDILKIEGSRVWIRTPSDDLAPVLAATGGWVGKDTGSLGENRVGWRIRGSGNWLSVLVTDGERDRVWRE